MKKYSKRYQECLDAVGGQTAVKEAHPVDEAATLVCKQAKTNFAESVDLAIRLNIDPRKSDQLVRGSFALPHGTGKTVRVVAFAEGADAEAATAAGAIAVGGEELAEKIQGGWMEFDVAVAHPSMMRFVGKLGKVLGPKGLMPSPKSGTVTPEVGEAVKEFAGGRIEFRNDAQGNISVGVGKVDFQPQQIAENIQALLTHIQSLRPAAVKGIFMKGATVSSTMGVGLPLQI